MYRNNQIKLRAIKPGLVQSNLLYQGFICFSQSSFLLFSAVLRWTVIHCGKKRLPLTRSRTKQSKKKKALAAATVSKEYDMLYDILV